MRYYIIAGEASGDLHASNLVRSMNELDADAQWRGWGGDLMAEQGVHIVKHYRDTAVMGVMQVLLKMRSIARNLSACKQDVLNYQPDVLILVDYPGFNLRIAAFAKQHGIRVFYYIAPKVWASRENRIQKIKAFTDHVFTILPFEVAYFKTHGVKASYVGNPVVDAIRNEMAQVESTADFRKRTGLDDRPIVALLSGSRVHEVNYVLPAMLSVVDDFKAYQFVVAGVDVLDKDIYNQLIKDRDIRVLYGETYQILRHAEAALVTSGTATLETALIGTPQVVCYNMGGGRALYWLYEKFIKVKYLSLVNLILDKRLVNELIQHRLTHAEIKRELARILKHGDARDEILKGYREIKDLLGDSDVSKNTAGKMMEMLR